MVRSLALALGIWACWVSAFAARHDLEPPRSRGCYAGWGQRACGCRSFPAEARTVLGGIKTSMATFHAEFDRYPILSVEPAPPDLGRARREWSAPDCPEQCQRHNLGACTSLSCVGYRPASSSRFHFTCDSNGVDYTCVAVSDLDEDEEYGAIVFGTSHDGTPSLAIAVPPQARVGRCKSGAVPAWEVIDCSKNEW